MRDRLPHDRPKLLLTSPAITCSQLDGKMKALLLAVAIATCSLSLGHYGAIVSAQQQEDSVEVHFGKPTRPPSELSAESLACLLGSARQLIKNSQLPLASPCGIPVEFNTRLFLTAWPAPQTDFRPFAKGTAKEQPLPTVATALEGSLEDTLAAAAKKLGASLGSDGAVGTLVLDFYTSGELLGNSLEFNNSLDRFCLDGYAFSDTHGKFGYILPNEACQNNGAGLKIGGGDVGKDLKLDIVTTTFEARLDVRTGMAQSKEVRSHAIHGHHKTRHYFRFRTRSYVHLSDGSIFEQSQGRRVEDIQATPEAMFAAVKRGAEYLVRSQTADGKWTYLWDAVTNEDLTGDDYNLLRHAGAAFFVADAFRQFPKEKAFIEAAENAVRWLEKDLIPMGKFYGKPMSSMCKDPRQQSRQVGCTGITLVGWAEMILRRHGSLEKGELEKIRQLGRYIVHQQYKDGHFRKNSDVMKEGKTDKKLKEEISYFQGEAEIGLMRLYEIDRNVTWRETALKGALWTILSRDRGVQYKDITNDHWLCYALLDLFRYYKSKMLVNHAVLVAKGTSYHGLASTTASVGTRLEALTSVLRMARFAPAGMFKDSDLKQFESSARKMATYLLQNQYDGNNTYFLPNPGRALGGFRANALDNTVRDDYVQHAGSGLLQLARLLSDANYEKDGARWPADSIDDE